MGQVSVSVAYKREKKFKDTTQQFYYLIWKIHYKKP
jgi:hypothetical protein